MARTEIRTVLGTDYQFKKMTPLDAGYLWQKLVAASYRAAQQAARGEAAPEEEAQPASEMPAEDRLRAICGVAFMNMTYDEYAFVQGRCIRSVSRMEQKPGVDGAVPMPVMADSGLWAIQEVADDPLLVTRLMVEAVVVNCAGFLAGSASAS